MNDMKEFINYRNILYFIYIFYITYKVGDSLFQDSVLSIHPSLNLQTNLTIYLCFFLLSLSSTFYLPIPFFLP